MWNLLKFNQWKQWGWWLRCCLSALSQLAQQVQIWALDNSPLHFSIATPRSESHSIELRCLRLQWILTSKVSHAASTHRSHRTRNCNIINWDEFVWNWESWAMIAVIIQGVGYSCAQPSEWDYKLCVILSLSLSSDINLIRQIDRFPSNPCDWSGFIFTHEHDEGLEQIRVVCWVALRIKRIKIAS